MPPRVPHAATLPAALIAATFHLTAAGSMGVEPGAVTLTGHVSPVLEHAVPLDPWPLDDGPLTLTVVLKRDDPDGFARYLRELYDPSAARYQQFLGAREVSDRFGPSRQSYDALLHWLESKGFRLSEGSANRLTLTVTGTRASAEAAFGVRVRDFRKGDGHFFANSTDPRLPADLAPKVHAVVGLSNAARPHHASEAIQKAWYAVIAALNCSACGVDDIDACVTKLKKGPGSSYTWTNAAGTQSKCEFSQSKQSSSSQQAMQSMAGSRIAALLAPSAGTEVDGTGQTVGLLQFDTFERSDIADYLALMERPAELIDNLSEVAVNGGAVPGEDDAEVLMDIINVMNLAPGAEIVVYHGPFTGAFTSFQSIFNRMVDDGVTIISNSWAYCEDQTTLADVQSIDAIFQAAAASGISVFNASGDTGSSCLNGSPDTIAVPAGAPHATAVGGTSQVLGPGRTYGSETWWDGASDSPPTGQGGFGLSRFFSRPDYQAGHVAAPMRSIPDVAINADPAQGVVICRARAGGCPDGRFYGGTSGAAPLWAGITALLNQALGQNLGFLNPLVYPLAGTDAFHSPAAMGSDFAHVGLGSPNMGALWMLLSGATSGEPDGGQSELIGWIRPPDHETVSRLGGVPADGVTPMDLVVTLRDADGDMVPGRGVRLEASPGSSVVIDPATAVSTVANSAAIFSVTNEVAERVGFSAIDDVNGTVLAEASVTFVVPPAVSASIGASPTALLNNGSAETAITVTLIDALGRPTPGKQVKLAQGSGRSVIRGPSPSVTDGDGQIVFRATNFFPETVAYTATDVTDGDLPIPGEAVVTFSGAANLSCVGSPPAAADGFSLEPFANGFFTQNLFFGNVNWGCTGVSNPAFTAAGPVLAGNFATGDLFRFPPEGGAVSSGDAISNLGPTLGSPVIGTDGRLYATHGATTGNFTTGNIVEIDPETGAQVRVVAANLTCPGGLAIDPLSGDLFYNGQCTGAGSNDSNIYRIRDPGGPSPTTEVYVDLGVSPNGAMSFAPDGTLYVVSQYFGNVFAPVLRVNGTDQPSPPTFAPVIGVTSAYWVTVGAADADGAATSLIVLDVDATLPDGLRVMDIGTSPPTATYLTQGGIGSGVIGPDGCLYATAADAIYRISPVSGACTFSATNPAPTLTLLPAAVSPDPEQGGTQTFTARLLNVDAPDGIAVLFQITGANGQIKLARADASGEARVDLFGLLAGADTLVATATVEGTPLTSNAARVNWIEGRHGTYLSLNPSPKSGAPGEAVLLSAVLTDIAVEPAARVAGEAITFDLDGASCVGVTDADGLASCSVAPAVQGFVTLSAEFNGAPDLAPSSDSTGFNVMAAATPENIIDGTPARDTLIGTAGNDRITGFGDRDSISTGGGNDRIVYTDVRDFGDAITDFQVGSDVIDLTALGIASGDPIAEGYLLFSERGGSTTVLFDADASGRGRPRPLAILNGVPAAAAAQLSNFTGYGP